MADMDPRRGGSPLPLPRGVALVLQGGGALGAYQAGVYEELAAAGIAIDQVAGISIGAVNAAIIAGNPPERRVERLRAFWESASGMLPSFPIWQTDWAREWLHWSSALAVASVGVPGMFRPRLLPPAMAVPGTPDALSLYDTRPLAETLDALVDWKLVNDGPVRLAVGAVDVASGNLRWFDSRRERLDARHVMASGALPPGFAPVEIDGRLWWDGGLVSNTPLSHVLDGQDGDLLVFQVDLFPAAAELPRTIADVLERAKQIQHSSRTRQVSDQLLKMRREREAIRRVLAKLPPALRDDPDVRALEAQAREHAVSLVQLIYRASAWEGGAPDYEFSARSVAEHVAAGRQAVAETMTRSGLVASNILDGGTAAFDLTRR